jgi:MFS family permease
MTDLASSRRVRVAQAVWLVVAVMGTAVWAVVPAFQWSRLQRVCRPDSACASFQLDASAARTLSEHGISLTVFTVYTAAVLVALWVLWYGLAVLIIWRKPEDRGAVLAAFFLIVLLPLGQVSLWVPSAGAVGGITFGAVGLFGLLFPDGRFAPRWTWWLAVAAIVASVLAALSPPLPEVAAIPIVLVLCAVVAVQAHRYRSISSWAQRQQTKWALVGLILGIVGFIAILLPFLFAPSVQTANGSLYAAFSTTGLAIVLSVIPISIGIAVLRNRLWDIDRVINRALVYTALSLTLAAIYIGGVIGLQALFRLVVGGSSTLAIALSTLTIAALFGPLRRRIQTGIDRRFYRSRYDAERILAAFGEQVRNQVDLAQLSQELTLVVHDALHPAHVSLWLSGAEQEIREDRGSQSTADIPASSTL